MKNFTSALILVLVALLGLAVWRAGEMRWLLFSAYFALLVFLYGEWARRVFKSLRSSSGRLVAARPWLARALLFTLLLALVLTTYERFPDRPTTTDHNIHFTKALITYEALGDGWLYGWTHHWFAGYPLNYFYPIGGYLLIALVSFVTPFASFDTAYGLGVALAYALALYGCFSVARRLGGAKAGVAAVLFFLFDRGHYDTGGWVWAMEVGVWPIQLSFAWMSLALGGLMDAFRTDGETDDPGSPRPCPAAGFARAAFFSGLALITHPLQIVHLAVLLLFFAAAAAVFARGVPARRWIAGLAFVGLGGAMIGALWLLPFFYYADFAYSGGNAWLKLSDLARGLVSGSLFVGFWPWAVILGLIGCAGLIFERRVAHAVIGIAPFGFLLAASRDFWKIFDLEILSGFFGAIEFVRFSMIIKFYLIIGASWFVARLLRWRRRSVDRLVRAALAFALVFFLVPLVVAAGSRLIQDFGIRRLPTATVAPYYQEKRAIAGWINERAAAERDVFFRVALDEDLAGGHNHEFMDFSTLVDVPVYKPGYTPAAFFKYKVATTEPWVSAALCVRFLVSADSGKVGKFRRVFSAGDLTVYEFKNWKERRPYSVRNGRARVRVLEFERENIVLEVEPGGSGLLVLHVASFPLWSVRRDDRDLPVQSYLRYLPFQRITNKEDRDVSFLAVELDGRGGRYEFRYKTGWVERSSILIALIGLLLVAFSIRRARKK